MSRLAHRRRSIPGTLARFRLSGEPLEVRALLTAGSLDLTFGTGGLVSVHPGDSVGQATATNLAVEPNGDIVQIGEATDPVTHNTDIAVVRFNANGTLDNSFGTGGIVLTPITTGTGTAFANQVLIDSQGRIVVVGGDGTDFELLRYTSGGALDTTFGTGGIVSTPIPGTNSAGEALQAAFDPLGNIIVAGSATSDEQGTFVAVFRYSSSGVLNTLFGQEGMACANLPNGQGLMTETSLIVEQDGSIVLGGNNNVTGSDWVLMRLTAAGLPDRAFGTDSFVTTSIVGAGPPSMVEQPDGKIVAVGDVTTAPSGFDIARYNSDGTLDTTFGTGGMVNTVFPSNVYADARDVALDTNGNMVVGGATTNGNFVLARYLSDGTLDPTFGTGGMTVTSQTDLSGAFGSDVSMVLDPSSNIVLGSDGQSFNLARFTGAPPVAATPSLSSADASARASASQAVPMVFNVQLSAATTQPVTVAYSTADGSAFVGTDYTATQGTLTFAPGVTSQSVTVPISPNTTPEANKNFVLKLSDATGAPLLNNQYSGTIVSNVSLPVQPSSLDFTFGWAGFSQANLGAPVDGPLGCFVQPDGRIVELGSAPLSGPDGAHQMALVRYNPNGTLDATFGTAGVATIPIGTGYPNSLALESNGDIVAVAGDDGSNVLVARYLPNGMLDDSFGTQGISTIQLPQQYAQDSSWSGVAVAIDSVGRIVIGVQGGSFAGVIRLNTNGSQDTTFGNAGLALLGASSEANLTSLVIEPNQDIVVAGAVGPDDAEWVIAQYTPDGILNTGFGTNGTIVVGAGVAQRVAALAAEPDGDIVAVEGTVEDSDWVATVSRYLPNGAADTAFDNAAGSLTIPGNSLDPTGLAILPGGMIVASGSAGYHLPWLAQFDADGAPDALFGANGFETLPQGTTSPGIALYYNGNQLVAAAPNGQLVLAGNGQVVPGDPNTGPFVARINDEGTLAISAPAVQQNVGLAATSMTFAVTLSQASTSPVTVQYTTSDGTAAAGTDYTTTTSTLTFAPGTTTQNIVVPISGNLYAGPSKSFAVMLSNPSGALVDNSEVIGTIDNPNVPSWTDPASNLDVNGDGRMTPIDALNIINYLNSKGAAALGSAPTGSHLFYDVNGDGNCTPIDALQVINYLNSQAASLVAGTLAPALSTDSSPGNGGAGSAAASNAQAAGGLNATALTDVAFAVSLGAPTSGGGNSVLAANMPSTATAAASGTATAGTGSASSATATATALSTSSATSDDYDPRTDVDELLDLIA